LTAAPQPAGTLTLHEADLLQDGAFDEVVRGAHFVFHTASPFFIKAEEDAQRELIDPALKGTQVVPSNHHVWRHGKGCYARLNVLL